MESKHSKELNALTETMKKFSEEIQIAWANAFLESKQPKSYTERVTMKMVKK